MKKLCMSGFKIILGEYQIHSDDDQNINISRVE